MGLVVAAALVRTLLVRAGGTAGGTAGVTFFAFGLLAEPAALVARWTLARLVCAAPIVLWAALCFFFPMLSYF